MIVAHMRAIEKVLIAQSAAAQNAGHPDLRGWPREWFIREFLRSHLPSSLEIGQGEIIDEDSQPSVGRDDYRPQVDIVIYRQGLPRIAYSRDNCAFLAEGVAATIESKSTLTEAELQKACKTACEHKKLKRSKPRFDFGQPHSPIWAYVVAYGGPENMSTVAGWMPGVAAELQAAPEQLVDLIVVLGKGVLWRAKAFDFPQELQILVPQDEAARWAFVQQPDENLFMLFVHMLCWTPYVSAAYSAIGYVTARTLFTEFETI